MPAIQLYSQHSAIFPEPATIAEGRLESGLRAPLPDMEKFYHRRLQQIANELCTPRNSPLISLGFPLDYFGLPIAL